MLQGTNDRIADYVDAIGATTASAYGASIRTALSQDRYLVSNITDYLVDERIDPDNLVTWVESHDNYYNDGTWSQLDNNQIILGWAIIGARANGTPLFFSRPEGSSTTNFYGTNTIGIAGDDTFKNHQVAAINKFRTAMAGEGENLTNPDGNAQVVMIERGSKGLVLVNGSTGKYPLDAKTNLADGTYINKTDDNSVFTVIKGEISGVIPAQSVVVLYEAEATNSTTVHFYNKDNWSSVYAYVSGDEVLGTEPGTQATNDGDGWFRVTVPADVEDKFTISFNNGGDEFTDDFKVEDSTKLFYANNIAYKTKADAELELNIVKTTVHFFNSSSWDDVRAYAYIDGTDEEPLGAWQGSVARSNGDGWWTVNIPYEASDKLHIIFNNNNGLKSSDFIINNEEAVYLTNENAETYNSKIDALTAIDMVPGTTVVYFYNHNDWAQVYAYTWGAVVSGSWPGKLAEDTGDGWWKIELPADPSMDMNLIFNNYDDAQTGDLLVSNITNRYFSPDDGKAYPSKAAVEELFVDRTLVSVVNPNAITVVVNGVAKTAAALGLPKVKLKTDKGDVEASVSWNVSESSYDPTNTEEQTFSVEGNVTLPKGVNNPDNISLEVSISVLVSEKAETTVYFLNTDTPGSVNAYIYGPGELFGGWPGTPTIKDEGGWWKITIPCAPLENLNVIFNWDGKEKAFVINNPTDVYVTDSSNTKYSSKEAAEGKGEPEGPEVDKILVSVVSPSAITAVVNGTEKTAAALGLPSTVKLETDNGDVDANVVWNISESDYDPSIEAEQTFSVNGIVTLPTGVNNPDDILLETTIDVTVLELSKEPEEPEVPEVPEVPEITKKPQVTRITISIQRETASENDKNIDLFVRPYIQDGRTMVGIRDIATLLGIQNSNVLWENKTKTIVITAADDKIIELAIDRKFVIVDGEKIMLDVAPQIKDGRTVLPVAHIARILGIQVEFDHDTKEVILGITK